MQKLWICISLEHMGQNKHFFNYKKNALTSYESAFYVLLLPLRTSNNLTNYMCAGIASKLGYFF